MRKQNTGTMLTVAWCAATLWSMMTLADDVNGDIVIVIPDMPPAPKLTDEQQERKDLLARLKKAVPYREGDSIASYYTFGQASKFCDWVVVGTVENTEEVKFHDSERKGNAPLFVAGSQTLFRVDTRLYGALPKEKLMFTIENHSGSPVFAKIEKRVAGPGDRALVFLTNKWHDPAAILAQPPFFSFDKSKSKWKETDIYAWSHIILGDRNTEDEVIRAVKGYLEFFGEKGKRDRDKYVEFLCSLLNSPVKRIRDDAESDLVFLYTKEKAPPPDLDKLLADGRVRKEVKDYLRYLLRNEKPAE